VDDRTRRALRDTVNPAAETAVFRGIMRGRRTAFVEFNREGLAGRDFTDPDHAALYDWCRGRWERDTPLYMVDIYRGVRDARDRDRDPRFRSPFFGTGFALWLADAFSCDWWPNEIELAWAMAEFADGRAHPLGDDLFLATVAARLVHLLAERRRDLIAKHDALAATVGADLTSLAGRGTLRVFRDDHSEEDDDVETQGPRR
jgi:hypothetical protein